MIFGRKDGGGKKCTFQATPKTPGNVQMKKTQKIGKLLLRHKKMEKKYKMTFTSQTHYTATKH